MDLGAKFWLEEKGKSVLGAGRLALLKAIESEGSIAGAAKKLRISFRSAWGAVGDAEENLGVKLLERRKGGAGGGWTNLTPEARELVAKFDRLVSETREFAGRRFHKIFQRQSP
jgi:molybdate transport system regulatory protein